MVKIKDFIMKTFIKVNTWWTSLTLFQKIWITASTFAVFLLGIIAKDSWINILIGTIGMCYVAVYSTGARFNFLLGIVYVGLYTIICLQNKIYLDALQNIILIPMYLISFIRWGKKKTEPKNLSWKGNLLSIGVTAALFGALYGLSMALGGNYSALDALNTSCTLMAMFLGIFGTSIVWLFWTVNNVASAVVFIMACFTPTGSIAVAAMKLVFVVNGLIGLINFYRIGKKEKISIK